MKHVLQILKFEYLSCIKNKAFIITTLLLIVMILLISIIPSILMSIASSDSSNSENNEKSVIAVSDKAYNDKNFVKTEFEKKYKDNYNIVVTSENQETLKNKVDSAEYSFAVIINSPVDYTYITKHNSISFNTANSGINDIIASMYKIKALEDCGISTQKADDILNVSIKSTTITTGTDQTKNLVPAYFLILILYMAIVTYSQLVSNSVITEKNSRAMEMLITCAKPSHLMFGKIFGAGLAGLSQLVVIIVVAVVSVGTIGLSALPIEIASYLNMPISTILYALLFFVLAFFIYAFLMGAFSSMASRTEDLTTLTTPIMFIFIFSFFIVITSITNGEVDGPLMQICSYIPFTAPLAIFTRIAVSDVPALEIIISVAIQLATIYGLGILASAIYRMGVLMYGKPPKFSEVIGMLKEQHKQNKKIKGKS